MQMLNKLSPDNGTQLQNGPRNPLIDTLMVLLSFLLSHCCVRTWIPCVGILHKRDVRCQILCCLADPVTPCMYCITLCDHCFSKRSNR